MILTRKSGKYNLGKVRLEKLQKEHSKLEKLISDMYYIWFNYALISLYLGHKINKNLVKTDKFLSNCLGVNLRGGGGGE